MTTATSCWSEGFSRLGRVAACDATAQPNRLKPSLQQPRSVLHGRLISLTFAALLLVASGCRQKESPSIRAKPLPQRAYVWQREWSTRVTDSLWEGSDVLDGCVVLAAEVEWRNNQPYVVTP